MQNLESPLSRTGSRDREALIPEIQLLEALAWAIIQNPSICALNNITKHGPVHKTPSHFTWDAVLYCRVGRAQHDHGAGDTQRDPEEVYSEVDGAERSPNSSHRPVFVRVALYASATCITAGMCTCIHV